MTSCFDDRYCSSVILWVEGVWISVTTVIRLQAGRPRTGRGCLARAETVSVLYSAQAVSGIHENVCPSHAARPYFLKSKGHFPWGLRSSEILRSVDWYLVTDVPEKPIGPIFKGQVVQEILLELIYWVTSQKSDGLIYTAAETWYRAVPLISISPKFTTKSNWFRWQLFTPQDVSTSVSSISCH
jgi:hypothetical protein